MKPEEEEIYNILKICFNSQKTIIETTVKLLKKYDPNTLKTVNLTLHEKDNTLKEGLENIFKVKQELEEDRLTVETHKIGEYIHCYNFELEHLYYKLDFLKRMENSFTENRIKEVSQELNIEFTPQETQEIKTIVKEFYTKLRVDEEEDLLEK